MNTVTRKFFANKSEVYGAAALAVYENTAKTRQLVLDGFKQAYSAIGFTFLEDGQMLALLVNLSDLDKFSGDENFKTGTTVIDGVEVGVLEPNTETHDGFFLKDQMTETRKISFDETVFSLLPGTLNTDLNNPYQREVFKGERAHAKTFMHTVLISVPVVNWCDCAPDPLQWTEITATQYTSPEKWEDFFSLLRLTK